MDVKTRGMAEQTKFPWNISFLIPSIFVFSMYFGFIIIIFHHGTIYIYIYIYISTRFSPFPIPISLSFFDTKILRLRNEETTKINKQKITEKCCLETFILCFMFYAFFCCCMLIVIKSIYIANEDVCCVFSEEKKTENKVSTK